MAVLFYNTGPTSNQDFVALELAKGRPRLLLDQVCIIHSYGGHKGLLFNIACWYEYLVWMVTNAMITCYSLFFNYYVLFIGVVFEFKRVWYRWAGKRDRQTDVSSKCNICYNSFWGAKPARSNNSFVPLVLFAKLTTDLLTSSLDWTKRAKKTLR